MNVLEIEKYLKNEMSGNEKIHFESCVNTDAVLKKELESHAAIFASFDQIRKEELLSRFGNILKVSETKVISKPGEPEKSLEKNFGYWRYAAAITGLILVGSIYFFQQGPAAESVYADNYTTYPNVISTTVRGDVKQINDLWLYYEAGEYKEAYLSLKEAIHQDPENPDFKFYLGITAMEIGKFDEAKELFISLGDDQEARFYEQARWYLGLAYLKLDNLEDAKSVFQNIADNSEDYGIKAVKVLDEL